MVTGLVTGLAIGLVVVSVIFSFICIVISLFPCRKIQYIAVSVSAEEVTEFRLDTTLGTFDFFLTGIVWAEIECTVHLALQDQTAHQPV